MANQNLYSFSISDFALQREWIVARPTNPDNNEKKLYIGKLGDDSNGCNPLITEIGNLLSHFDDDTESSNKLYAATEYNYYIFFAKFGQYKGEDKSQLEKINQLEKKLTKLIQSKLKGKVDYKLLNSNIGKQHIQVGEKAKRRKKITKEEIKILGQLANVAVRKVIRNIKGEKIPHDIKSRTLLKEYYE